MSTLLLLPLPSSISSFLPHITMRQRKSIDFFYLYELYCMILKVFFCWVGSKTFVIYQNYHWHSRDGIQLCTFTSLSVCVRLFENRIYRNDALTTIISLQLSKLQRQFISNRRWISEKSNCFIWSNDKFVCHSNVKSYALNRKSMRKNRQDLYFLVAV